VVFCSVFSKEYGTPSQWSELFWFYFKTKKLYKEGLEMDDKKD
jgi:hypothetical protein